MDKKRVWGLRVCYVVGVLALLTGCFGCSLNEALVDGFFGGISDTIAALVSGAAIGIVSVGTP